MNFEILSEITDVEIIAVGSSIHDLARFRRKYGRGRWRKLKGIATVRLQSGRIRIANFIGTRLMASGARKLNVNATKTES